MKKIAVVFASRKGQTRKIAEYIQWNLDDGAHDVTLIDLSRIGRRDLPRDTDAVLIGGPVYVGRFPRKLIRWISSHHDALHGKPTGFFSVSLNAADQREESREADKHLLHDFMDESGWIPDFVASFAGALKYHEYSGPIRRIMVQRSASAGGPIDTQHDYEFTDWKQVDRFLNDFIEENRNSAFATSNRLSADWAVNHLMPEFEHFWVHETEVDAPPAEVFQALQDMSPADMKLAKVLGKIRTLGRGEDGPAGETFAASAEKFGNVSLIEQRPHQLVAGLIGQFWRPSFGIKAIKAAEFPSFDEPGYAKVLTSFQIDPRGGGERSCVRTELRIHSTSPDAARKFKLYWTLLNPGIKLYMRSMLGALRREAAAQAA